MEINSKEIQQRSANFKKVCQEKNVRCTVQFSAVFDFLASTTSHPSAETIYQKISKQIPQISLTTVYKNLEKLENLGLAKQITVPNGATRWDAHMSDHQHIVNLDTGDIQDIQSKLKIPSLIQQEFALDSVGVHYFVRNKLIN